MPRGTRLSEGGKNHLKIPRGKMNHFEITTNTEEEKESGTECPSRLSRPRFLGREFNGL